jgi:hypothetical protein
MSGKARPLPLAALLVLALVLAAGSPAVGKGVVLVQQSDGAVKTYSDVYILLTGQTLTLRTSDRKGTLTVVTGACSFDKEVQRCLPYAVRLTQNGKTHRIAIDYGTLFLNTGAAPQHLPLSSEMLAPHTVLVLFKSAHGTYVTAKGTLDGVRP